MDANEIRARIIGLAEPSLVKSYYPQLQARIQELEQSQARLEEKTAALLNILEDLQEARDELQKSEEKFRTLFEHISDGILVVNPRSGKISLVNEMACRLLEYECDELIGLPLQRVWPGWDVKTFQHLVDRSSEKLSAGVIQRFKKREGGEIPVEAQIARVETQDQTHLMVMFEDVSQQVEAEAIILTNSERLRQMLEISQQAAKLSEREIMERGIDLAARLTGSEMGYFHLIGADQATIADMVWSQSLRQMYADRRHPEQIPPKGVWNECIRLKTPIIQNDMQAVEMPPGFPPDHPPLIRHLCAPVVEGGRVVVIVGAANKGGEYGLNDALQLQLVADDIWKIIQRRREEQRREEELRWQQLWSTLAAGANLISAEDYEEQLSAAMQQLGEYAGAERALIAQVAPELQLRVLGSWTRDGVSPSLRMVNLERAPYTLETLRRGEVFQFSSLADLPKNAASDRRTYQSLGLRARLSLPLMAGGHWIGELSFSMFSAERKWPPELIQRLKLVSDLFAQTLTRLNAEERLRASEERFRRLAENAADAIFSIRILPRRMVDYVSPAIRQITGYDPTEFYQDIDIIERLIHPDDHNLIPVIEQGLLPSGSPVIMRIIRKDGRAGWIELRFSQVFSSRGELEAIEGIARDITSRRESEEALRQANRVVENSPVMIFRWGAGSGWPVELVSENISQLGYSAEELRTGKIHYPDLIHPADLYRVETENEEYVSLGVDRYFQEYRLITRDGRVRWVNDLTTVTRDERGQPLYFDSVVMDITERKQAELALRQRVAEMEAVERVSSALRAADQLSMMLPVLLDEMLGILNAPAGAIALYHPMDSVVQYLETRGWLDEVRDMFREADVFLSPVVARRAPVHLLNWALDPGMPMQYRSRLPGGWGGAILPLQAADRILGVALISVQQPRTLNPDELRLLETLSAIAGNAIHRAQSFEQTQRSLKRIAALHEIDNIIRSNLDVRLTLGIILDLVLDQMGADAADILLSEGDATTLVLAAGRGFRTWNGEQILIYLGEDIAGRAALEMRRIEYGPDEFRTHSSTRASLLAREGFRRGVSAPLTSKGQLVGMLDVYRRQDRAFNADQIDFLTVLAGQTAVAVESLRLLENLQRSNLELVVAYNDTIEGWSRAMDLRDRETEGHTQRVTEMTLKLARHMGLSEAELAHVRRGALLHDIGKIGVPDHILNKPGSLTDEEWAVMRKHPQFAYDLISPIAYLAPALDIPYCHHEKWDGSGYPRGLKGGQIPLSARLFAVVDVFDALTSDRPYRPAWSKQKALAYIRENAGSHFDPACVEAFFDLFGEDKD